MGGVDDREWVGRTAANSVAAGDPTGWFETVYAAAEAGEAMVPWNREAPQELLVRWTTEEQPDGVGRSALVVGCGFGDDAEHLAAFGFEVTAFDVSASAIRAARRRFPDSGVDFVTADLLSPPARWQGAFDLVVECRTVQSLPVSLHRDASVHIGRMVARGGRLLVGAAAREEFDDPEQQAPPWPLSRSEIDHFEVPGLVAAKVELVQPMAGLPRRWYAEFRRS